MKFLWLVVVATLGCSGKKDKDPPKPRPVVADAGVPCAETVAALTDWLRKLVGEGHRNVIAPGVNLVKLDDQPAPIPRGMVVSVNPATVIIEGTAVGNPTTAKGMELSRAFIDRASVVTSGPGVVFVIDENTRWATVAALANAAPDAKRARVTFVFTATGPSGVEPPPPSSLDAQFAEIAKSAGSGSAAKLADPVAQVDDATLYKDCPAVTVLWPKLDALTPDIFDVAIADELPKAIELCDCKVEIPAVQRVLWAMWGRDTGAAMVGITVEMAAKTAKDGTKVKAMPDALWSEAHKAVLDAAQAGKPLVFE